MNHGHHLNYHGSPPWSPVLKDSDWIKKYIAATAAQWISRYLKNGDLAMDFTNNGDLVGGDWNMTGLFFVFLGNGMSSSQLTNSLHYFSEG